MAFDKMKILIGIIIFRSEINLLLKNLLMFSRQNDSLQIKIILLDNDNGLQIRQVKKIINENLDEAFLNNIYFLSSSNKGFGAGHNKIFAYAKQEADFDYYLCVNPDGIPHKDMLGELVLFARNNNNRGIFEARQFPVEHAKTYDPLTGRTGWCSGCCLLFPKAVFDEVGGFDENFFMYMEDVDISWRVQLKGYGCFTVPNALFSHLVYAGERDMDFEKSHMLISGFKIALKYNNKKFQKYCVDRLTKILDKKTIKEIEQGIEKKHERYELREFINFDNKFHFSPVRW